MLPRTLVQLVAQLWKASALAFFSRLPSHTMQRCNSLFYSVMPDGFESMLQAVCD